MTSESNAKLGLKMKFDCRNTRLPLGGSRGASLCSKGWVAVATKHDLIIKLKSIMVIFLTNNETS